MASRPVIGTKQAVKDALRTRSGIVGVAMLVALFGVAIVVPFYAPFDVVRSWSVAAAWTDNPRNAAPQWVDVFYAERLARNIHLNEEDFASADSGPADPFKVQIVQVKWNYEFDQYPTELTLHLRSNWTTERKPILSVIWVRPDGEQVTIHSGAPTRLDPSVEIFKFDATPPIQEKVRVWAEGLGADPVESVRPRFPLYSVVGPGMMDSNRAEILHGRYTLRVTAILFGDDDFIAARLLNFGSVFGLAGTDSQRRDLLIGIMWGAPVALAFGAIAAFVTVFSQVILGALGAYYGGRFDEFIQRATDFFLIIPVLPILILIGAFYTPSLAIILLIIILFSIVGGTTKVVRSIALQVKEELHIESARSYGASRGRILFRYILPRTMPYTFALLALAVPSFIFLEAALSFLGLGDPLIPTWGAIMGDAFRNGAMYNGLWWWIAFPAIGILIVTVAFAFLGYSFDKVLNPRLREE